MSEQKQSQHPNPSDPAVSSSVLLEISFLKLVDRAVILAGRVEDFRMPAACIVAPLHQKIPASSSLASLLTRPLLFLKTHLSVWRGRRRCNPLTLGDVLGFRRDTKGCAPRRLLDWVCSYKRNSIPNARPEWRGGEDVEMQTGRAIPRSLQADGSALLYQSGGGICLSRKS